MGAELQNLAIGAPDAQAFSGRAHLEWHDPREGRKQATLDRDMIVGTAPHADIRLEDAHVARLHAEFTVREDGVWVRDLQTKAGTTVMGLRVEHVRVPHQGRVVLGNTELVLIHEASPSFEAPAWPDARFHDLVGGSKKMRELYAKLARVAASAASVLIGGETGTGKELVARSLHAASPRASRPFVVVDCASLPEHLLDAELFGHTRGAFTGAVGPRTGAIESANGGTVFLDEVGELPKSMQPKLLRVLEARTVRRIGENEQRSVDVRFVSATHRDLLKMVTLGEFREDLYFRLGVIPITVPSLRERLDDIEMLAVHFMGEAGTALSPELTQQLRERLWPGNVRELRNFIDRLKALGEDEALELTGGPPSSQVGIPIASSSQPYLPARASSPSLTGIEAPSSARIRAPSHSAIDLSLDAHPAVGAFRAFRDQWADRVERYYVEKLLERHNQNVSSAAREAELDRTYLYKLMRKHGRSE
ncbi:MAG: sigma 54-interacting transcriptional regulator [Polyangiaceae bacterium]